MSLIHLKFCWVWFSFLLRELTIVCDCRVGMSSANNLDENLTRIWLGNHKKRDKNNHTDHKKIQIPGKKVQLYWSNINLPVALPLLSAECQEFNKRRTTNSRQHTNGIHSMQNNCYLCLQNTRPKYHLLKCFCFLSHRDRSEAKLHLCLC